MWEGSDPTERWEIAGGRGVAETGNDDPDDAPAVGSHVGGGEIDRDRLEPGRAQCRLRVDVPGSNFVSQEQADLMNKHRLGYIALNLDHVDTRDEFYDLR